MICSPVNLLKAGFLFFALLSSLTGCSGMKHAQAPDLKLESVHLFGVTKIAFSPDGKLIASGGFKGDIALWTVPDGQALWTQMSHRDTVRGLVWVDNQQLLSAGEEGSVQLYDVTKRQLISQQNTQKAISSLAYLEKARKIVVGYDDGFIESYSYPDLEFIDRAELKGQVLSIVAHPDGARIAVSTESQQVLLMEHTLKVSMEFERPSKRALELRFSPDGKELAAGAWYQVFYWNIDNGKLRQQATESWGAVISLDYDPKGGQLITLGRHTDANLRLVDKDNGEVLRRLQGHRLCGAAVRFSPDGRYIASGSDDESLRLYDLSKPYNPQKPATAW